MAFLEGKRIIVAKFKAKDGSSDKLKEKLAVLSRDTGAKENCIEHVLHRSASDENLFLTYESWETLEIMQQEKELPHLSSFIEENIAVMEERPEVSVWESVTGLPADI